MLRTLRVGHFHEEPHVCFVLKFNTKVLAEVPVSSNSVLDIPGDSSANIEPQNDRLAFRLRMTGLHIGLRMTGFIRGLRMTVFKKWDGKPGKTGDGKL